MSHSRDITIQGRNFDRNWVVTESGLLVATGTKQELQNQVAVSGVSGTSDRITQRGIGVADVMPMVESATVTTGGDEPIFQAGVDTSSFFDDFQAFDDTADLMTFQSHFSGRWGFENGGPAGVLGVEGANKFFRAPYSTGESNILIETSYNVSANFSAGERMITTFQFRPSNNYPWATPGGANKIFLFFDTRMDFIIGTEPQVPSLSPSYPSPPTIHFTCNTEGQNWQQNMGMSVHPETINDGQWHRVTWAVTFPTVAGRGRIEMWIDGTKVMEFFGDDSERAEFGLVDIPSPNQISVFHFPANRNFSVPSGVHTLDFDDVRVWQEAA